jgi:hypothetical protein
MNTNKQFKAIRRMSQRKLQGGWILGVLLALVLAAGVTLVMYNQYSSSDSSSRYQKNSNYVVQTIGAAKATYGSSGYSGLTTAISIGANVIPSPQQSSSSAAINDWSGAVTLVDNNATTSRTGLLSWALVPTADCVNLVTSTQNLARRIDVAGTAVKALDGTLNMTMLNTQCTSAAQVSVAWTIGAI